MKNYLSVLILMLLGLCLLLVGLAWIVWREEPAAGDDLQGEAWCEYMMTVPNAQWQEQQAHRFAAECLVE